MSEAVDVAIVGAGPYGLSVAAHLRAAGLSCRQFGLPMRLWREAMPRGMYLKSQGFASNLSDPEGSHTLEAFCRKTGHPYASYGLPVPLDTFISYGQWFADELVPSLEEVMVTEVARQGDGFAVSLASGETVRASNVVVAAGVEHFARVPRLLADLPDAVCTHASAHTDLSTFAGQRVVVVGAGQSALESAALLHESGADVQIVARASRVRWNGVPLDPDRPLPQRMREPESGLGSGWSTWFYSRHPEIFRHLPEQTRIDRARTALGPAGASWLRVPGGGPVPGADQPRRPLGHRRLRRLRRRGPARPDHQGRVGQGAGGRPRHRGHRVPAGPDPAVVPGRRAAGAAGHRGRVPGGRP